MIDKFTASRNKTSLSYFYAFVNVEFAMMADKGVVPNNY
jgi:hypothetical protein